MKGCTVDVSFEQNTFHFISGYQYSHTGEAVVKPLDAYSTAEAYLGEVLGGVQLTTPGENEAPPYLPLPPFFHFTRLSST